MLGLGTSTPGGVACQEGTHRQCPSCHAGTCSPGHNQLGSHLPQPCFQGHGPKYLPLQGRRLWAVALQHKWRSAHQVLVRGRTVRPQHVKEVKEDLQSEFMFVILTQIKAPLPNHRWELLDLNCFAATSNSKTFFYGCCGSLIISCAVQTHRPAPAEQPSEATPCAPKRASVAQ